MDFLISLFSFNIWTKFEKSEYKYRNKDINKLVSINILEETKEVATKNHNNMIQQQDNSNILKDYIILYSDGSKLEENNGVGIYDLNSKNSYVFNIGK